MAPKRRVDFYHVVLRASGRPSFPDTEEHMVAALQKAYKNDKLPGCFEEARGNRKARFKINTPGIVFNGEELGNFGYRVGAR